MAIDVLWEKNHEEIGLEMLFSDGLKLIEKLFLSVRVLLLR